MKSVQREIWKDRVWIDVSEDPSSLFYFFISSCHLPHDAIDSVSDYKRVTATLYVTEISYNNVGNDNSQGCIMCDGYTHIPLRIANTIGIVRVLDTLASTRAAFSPSRNIHRDWLNTRVKSSQRAQWLASLRKLFREIYCGQWRWLPVANNCTGRISRRWCTSVFVPVQRRVGGETHRLGSHRSVVKTERAHPDIAECGVRDEARRREPRDNRPSVCSVSPDSVS